MNARDRHDAAGIHMSARHHSRRGQPRSMEENCLRQRSSCLTAPSRLAGILTDRDLALAIGSAKSRSVG